jgi:MoxR-like ATPase
MLLNIDPLSPQDFAAHLDTLYAVKQPALLLGSPGSGKSSIIEQWANSHNYHLVTRMLSQTQPGDLCIPNVDDSKGVLRWNTADWLVELPDDKPTIFFFDELTSAPIEVRTQM